MHYSTDFTMDVSADIIGTEQDSVGRNLLLIKYERLADTGMTGNGIYVMPDGYWKELFGFSPQEKLRLERYSRNNFHLMAVMYREETGVEV